MINLSLFYHHTAEIYHPVLFRIHNWSFGSSDNHPRILAIHPIQAVNLPIISRCSRRDLNHELSDNRQVLGRNRQVGNSDQCHRCTIRDIVTIVIITTNSMIVRRVIPKMQKNIGDITKYRRYIDRWIFEDLRKGGALLGRTQSTIHREGKWTDISEKSPVKAPKAGTSKSSPEEIAQMREQANTQHRRLLIMLKNRLLARGWEKIGQKTGSVDMRATKGKTVIFFEAKTIQKQNESRQIRLAVGQLLEYRFIHGTKKEHLCMALSHEPDKSRLGFLDSLPIGVIWRVGSGFRGNGEAKRVLKDAVK